MGIGYDDGGTNNEAKSALEHYLGSPYVPTIKNVLSQADIITVINNIDPAYLQCRRPNGFLRYEYHAVALTGYLFSDTQTAVQLWIRLMNALSSHRIMGAIGHSRLAHIHILG